MAYVKRIVLDEMKTPDGVLELVTYREQEATCVGVARKGDGLITAIALGTGSYERQIEASAVIDRRFAVAFGGVAPGIVRVEVRNEEGETFDARIYPLPDGFGTEYRAVWGAAERCRDRCEIVGYDEEGRMYDRTDPRVYGPAPSDEERLEAIRAHAHGSMRYYASAYLRETEDNKRLIQNFMGITANFLSLLEGAALADRSMLARREKIVQRYIEQAKSDAWEPGTCSFCGERPVVAWFEGPDFRTFVRSSAEVRAEEAWLACPTCLRLVESDDREELARRGAARLRRPPDERTLVMERGQQQHAFWIRRDRA